MTDPPALEQRRPQRRPAEQRPGQATAGPGTFGPGRTPAAGRYFLRGSLPEGQCSAEWYPATCRGYDQRSPITHRCMDPRALPHVCRCARCGHDRAVSS